MNRQVFFGEIELDGNGIPGSIWAYTYLYEGYRDSFRNPLGLDLSKSKYVNVIGKSDFSSGSEESYFEIVSIA